MTDMIYGMVLGLSILLGLSGFVMGLSAIINVKALQKSTHAVQYVPIGEQEENDESVENWQTTEESLAKQQKMFKDDLEEQMPEFALDDEDRKKFSF